MNKKKEFYANVTLATAPPPTTTGPITTTPAAQYLPQQSRSQQQSLQPIPTITVQVYPYNQPVPHPEPPATGWFARNHKNKPQSNSLGAAVMIITTGGMNIAWSVGFAPTYFIMGFYLKSCWYVATIIGAIIGAFLVNRLSKKIQMLASSLLVTIGGILFLACSKDIVAVSVARHLNGLAVGLVFVPTLVMAGEESVKTMRGMLASSVESMSFSTGAFLQILYSSVWIFSSSYTFDAGQMHGLLCTIFGVIGLIFAQFLTIESPVYFLVHGQEQEALNSLRRLQRPGLITYETYEQLEAHKSYIAENNTMSWMESLMQSLPALFKLCLYRGIIALSFSLLLTSALVVTKTVAYGMSWWPLVVYGFLRWFGSFVGIFLIDPVGRKKPLIISMCVCGAIALAVGAIFSTVQKNLRISMLIISLYLLFIYQFFCGILGLSSSAYLSEAFPLAVKPFCIAMAFIVEMLVQIIITVTTLRVELDDMSDYFYVLGAFLLAFAIVAILALPETRNLNLRKAQAKFRGLLSRGL